MNAFKKWVGFVLFLGFLWLGVPKCTEIPLMSAEDRQKMDLLCKMVERDHAVVARPDMLPREEWLLVLARYRRAEELELRMLEKAPNEYRDCTGPLVSDLARRLEGK